MYKNLLIIGMARQKKIFFGSTHISEMVYKHFSSLNHGKILVHLVIKIVHKFRVISVNVCGSSWCKLQPLSVAVTFYDLSACIAESKYLCVCVVAGGWECGDGI